MKVLVMDLLDDEGVGVNLAVRAGEYGHEIRYWSDVDYAGGKGLVDKTRDWKASMDWADLIVLSGNCDYPKGLEGYFERGYPLFGTNPRAAELELDRGVGQKVLKDHGIETIPFKVVSSLDDAIKYIAKEDKGFAIKPWGGECDKALTFVAKTANEAVFTLERWKKEGLFKGDLMIQELVDGVEIGIAGWFGPGGWSEALEESFEHKKLMNDDLGGNTGEMGTVIQHVRKSKLFDMVLRPLTDYLHKLKFVGDCNVNCMVVEDRPLPMEFTMRLGWPDFNIRQEVIQGDPVGWMKDLLEGRDSFRVRTDVVCGVCLCHGDFPREADDPKDWSGYPISGITPKSTPHVHLQQAQYGRASVVRNGKVDTIATELTAGARPLIVTGAGKTVREAIKAAYDVAWSVTWPSNVMFRTDIGERLKKDLPKLHEHGFALNMEY